jgi:hypothetical protein
VWAAIAPDWQKTVSATGGGSSSRDYDSSSSSSESDAGSSIEDEAVPSLKEIAAHHHLMVARTLRPTLCALLAVTPSICTLLQQQGRDSALHHLLAVVREACGNVFKMPNLELFESAEALLYTCSNLACGYASSDKFNNKVLLSKLGTEEEAALACMLELPFAFSNVLQVAAGSSPPPPPAAAAAAVPLASSTPAAEVAGLGQGAGTSSNQQASSSAQAGSRSPTPAASPQQRIISMQQQQQQQQPSPRSSGVGRSWGCHYAGCTNLCGVSELAMPVYGCSGCRSAGFSYACTYCSSACQQADWPVHKQACRQVRRQSSKGPPSPPPQQQQQLY